MERLPGCLPIVVVGARRIDRSSIVDPSARACFAILRRDL
jgi:hypothetical protein